MNRSALFLIVPLLAACNVHSKNPANGDENVSIHADESGHVSFNLPMAQGQVKVPAGFMHNGDMDIDGVKLMPGSQITGFNMDASKGNGANIDMSFSAPAAPDAVRAYYVDAFKKQGVEAAVSGDTVTGKSEDGSPFTIHVSPAAHGSQGKIEIQSKH
jgi:hypothetical protein